jgi:hypothetical protein
MNSDYDRIAAAIRFIEGNFLIFNVFFSVGPVFLQSVFFSF